MVEGSGEEEDEEEEEEGEEGEEGEKRDPKAPLKKYPLHSKEGSILRWVELIRLRFVIDLQLLPDEASQMRLGRACRMSCMSIQGSKKGVHRRRVSSVEV